MQEEKLDITVQPHSYRAHTPIRRGRLELLCGGSDLNSQFINAIGRIAVKRIPTYAFAKELIHIERIDQTTGYRDSIPFNHDMMRERLKNTPCMNLDPEISYLHDKYWKDVDYLSPDRPKHENEKLVEAYVDEKNTNDDGEILHVTTNHMKVYVDNELTSIYDRDYPLLLISLKPREAFKCSLKAVVGIGINDASWDACSNYCFDQETIPDMTILKLESASRFDEYVLVQRSLEYFRIRANLLKDEIRRLYGLEKQKTNKFIMTIRSEDHTMGEPINYEIQSHPNIVSSSVSKPDHLVREIRLCVVAISQETLLDSVCESIDRLVRKIDRFEKEFGKIAKPLAKPLAEPLVKPFDNPLDQLPAMEPKKPKRDKKKN